MARDFASALSGLRDATHAVRTRRLARPGPFDRLLDDEVKAAVRETFDLQR